MVRGRRALVTATGGRFVDGAGFRSVGRASRRQFGMLGDGRTAVVEMAAASGLVLVPPDAEIRLRTSTKGTGELLLAAVAEGAQRVILGIGGSATNDGGAGLAQALGYRLLDARWVRARARRRLARVGSAASTTASATADSTASRWRSRATLTTRCAARRGRRPCMGRRRGRRRRWLLSSIGLSSISRDRLRETSGLTIRNLPGAGAAGGLGGGLVAFAGGRLEHGIDLVIDAVGLADRLRNASLCLTGEGALDGSSAFGKTAVGVARLAKKLGCPTIALAGTIGPGAEAVHEHGIDAYFSLCHGPITLDAAVAHAAELLEKSLSKL